MRAQVVLVAWLFFIGPALASENTRYYDWISGDLVAGSQVLVIAADGVRTADFEFNDRGRGPRLHETSRVDSNGLLTSLEINGHSYMGAPVEERFAMAEGEARWNSTLENGTAPEGSYYWASEGTPERLAMLARALLKAESGTLTLYPAGSATIRRVAESTVAVAGIPDAGNGEKMPVSLYAITGLGLTPEYIWLDPAGELFALTPGWMDLVPQGQAAIQPALREIQVGAETAWQHQLAVALTQQLPLNWRLRNVTVVDVESGTLLPKQAVDVSAGWIVGMGADPGADGNSDLSAETLVIDGEGRYLVPGLWDMHTHLSQEDGLLHIAAGVTTVRDLGNAPQRYAQVRDAFDSGEVIGPRSYVAGFIDRKSPYSAPAGKLAESEQDALDMVREYAAMGYPQIKIYSSIDPAWVPAIAAETHKNGMRLSGHIPSYMTAEQAVNDGFDEIQHINMLFLNFLAGPEDDTRTPLRFTLVAENAGSLNLDSAEVTAFIALLKQKGIVIDPTVGIFDSMFRHRSGQLDPSFAMVADHMPPAERRKMLAGDMDINESNAARYAASAEALLNLIDRLYRAGVPLVAGTDNIPGFALHRELELYQQAGLAADDVLRIATINAAGVMGAAEYSGSIAIGKQADFVLLSANPLLDINAVRTPVAVIRGERLFDPANLYEAIGIQPFTLPDASPAEK